MFRSIKKYLYFPVAVYFRFFATIKLKKWHPRIIVITGSSGKTTLLHLIESQLGGMAKYSHDANSSIGIPFDILGLHRKSLTLDEWPLLFLLAPFKAFSPSPKEKLYVVEADCDRPNEGDFLSLFLRPEVTLWINVGRTHVMNFEDTVKRGRFSSVEESVAFEFGYFAERTRSLVIVNEDSELVQKQLKRVKCKVDKVSSKKNLTKYEITLVGTMFELKNEKFTFPYLLPKETSVSVLQCLSLLSYLGVRSDKSFVNFRLPPGRNSFFRGIKNITIVDSTYNANLDSMSAVIGMFARIRVSDKWVVLGDMLELGSLEREEHEKLADVISNNNFKRVILMGPRISKYTYPKLKKLFGPEIVIINFLNPKEVLDYLQKNIRGGEVILFKGARFLEGVVEGLLENKDEAKNLARREKIWEIRRKKWGL